MENKLFWDKKIQKIYRAGGMDILLLSYPEIKGETPLAQHCRALTQALCAYAEGEPLSIARNALSKAVKEHRLFAFSRHSFQINLHTVLKKGGIVCTLQICFYEGQEPIFTRELSTLWAKNEHTQRRMPRRRRSSALPLLI